MSLICWIWLVFTLIFILLGLKSLFLMKNKISHIAFPTRPGSNQGNIKILGTDIDKPINDFIAEFNKYLDNYNNSTKKQNLIAGLGYLFAAIVSLVSFILSKG